MSLIDLLPTFVFWYSFCLLPALAIMVAAAVVNIEDVRWMSREIEKLNMPKRSYVRGALRLIAYPYFAFGYIDSAFNADRYIRKMREKYGYK